MPLKRPKLPDEDIAVIRQWIEDGASLEAVEDAVPEEQRTSDARAVLENRAIRPTGAAVLGVPEATASGDSDNTNARADAGAHLHDTT